MKTTTFDARTVAIVKNLTVEQRTGANGAFESKTILFRIAVDRDYKVQRTENGKTYSEYPTDFWLVKATGNVAQAFADNCTMTKDDGKLVSRHLLLQGSFENYTNTRKQQINVQPQVDINGTLYQLNLDLTVDVPNNNNTIFVVDSMRFLDKKPETAQPRNDVTVASVTPAAVSPVPVAPVVQQLAQQVPVAAPVATSAPVAQQPIHYAPQAPQAAAVATSQPVAAPIAQPVAQVVNHTAMNAPVVEEGFVPGGYICPF